VLGRHGDASYFGRWIYGQVMLPIRGPSVNHLRATRMIAYDCV
jgi:hypothetical protein